MNKEVLKDEQGRIRAVVEMLPNESVRTKSIIYKSDKGNEIDRYKIEIVSKNGDRDIEIYDSMGRIVEDYTFREHNIPTLKHTYLRGQHRSRVEVGIYTGKDGSFHKVNFNYARESDLKTIVPDKDFSDFFKQETNETALDKVVRENPGYTPAEVYGRVDGSLQDDRPAPRVSYEAPETVKEPLPEAKFDAEGKARFDFNEDQENHDPETPGMGTY